MRCRVAAAAAADDVAAAAVVVVVCVRTCRRNISGYSSSNTALRIARGRLGHQTLDSVARYLSAEKNTLQESQLGRRELLRMLLQGQHSASCLVSLQRKLSAVQNC